MKQNRRSLAVLLLTGVMMLGLTAVAWFAPAKDYSESERRVLADFPLLNMETVLSGKFMKSFETYTQDQFPLRDGFRWLKALSALYLFREKDNNDIYVSDGYVSKLEYPLKTPMLNHAADRFAYIMETYLAGTDVETYLSIVPDKNYFLAEENGYPALDYNRLVSYMKENCTGMEYIDIFPLLSIEDYYRTDTHWRQEAILPVAEQLAQAMGATLSADWREELADTPFNGVYVGQSALPLKPDALRYLMSEVLEQAKVQIYDDKGWRESTVYNMELAAGKDPYEMFLSGAESLITVENPLAKTDKELILFRDSFGSSIAPLLLSGYAKITLVDIRYLPSNMLGELIEFNDQDVLFLYSSLILNASSGLR